MQLDCMPRRYRQWPSYICVSVRAGIEGAVHVFNDLFEINKSDGWGVLLIDADSAFNSLNRTAALRNMRMLWPRCSQFLFNTNRGWAALDPRRPSFCVSIYAIGSLPPISSLNHPDGWLQVWYTDDSSACSDLESLKEWFSLIKTMSFFWLFY